MKAHRWLGFVLGVCFSATFVWTISSWADNEIDNGPRVIPYDGKLSHGGAAFDGSVDLLFAFGTTEDDGSFVERWRESHEDVPVYNGVFKVNIGSRVPLSEPILHGVWVVDAQLEDYPLSVEDALNLTVSVRPSESDSDEDYVRLVQDAQTPGRSIHPVPFAYWHANSSDLHIDGDAAVAGLEVRGVARKLKANGAVSALEVSAASVGALASNSPSVFQFEAPNGEGVGVTQEGNVTTFDGSEVDGIRLVAGDSELQITNGVVELNSELELAPSGSLYANNFTPAEKETSGNLLQVENERIARGHWFLDINSVPNIRADTIDLGESERRFCALTITEFGLRQGNAPQLYPEQNESCTITQNRGHIYLKASTTYGFMECRARCITW